MDHTKMLRTALKANAGFSACSGIVLILFHEPIATFMGLTSGTVLWVIGTGLCAFVILLWQSATRPEINAWQVRLIILQDWLWVLGSALLISLQAFGISFGGYLLMGAIALVVADFALVQSFFLKKMTLQE